MLGYGEVEWERVSDGVKVFIPEEVRNNPPCAFAWSFNIFKAK
jgi:hypothetical protein